MIPLEMTEDGIDLSVKAHPGARRNAVTGIHDGALKVAVSQAPEKGKATAAVIEVLAKSLGLKKNQIELISGQTSTHKRVRISGITPEELTTRISALLADLESMD